MNVRMIRVLAIVLSFPFALLSWTHAEQPPPTALLVTMIQDPQVLSSQEDIVKLITFAKKANVGTLYVQIYRANQAWFPSAFADSTPYAECLKKVGQDPFALLLKESHSQGLKVFAWFNTLSLSKNEKAPMLKKYGPGILTRNRNEKKTLGDYKIDNQYFLEPGDMRVREDLLNIVEEIVDRYPDLDGILFDYIRYPDVHPFYGYTQTNMARFKKATGSTEINEKDQAWRRWKRDQVTALLQVLIKRARSVRPHLTVAAAGCVSYVRAYEEAFQDWPSWIKRDIVDFVVLMNYPPDIVEFDKNIKQAKEKVADFTRVHMGVGAYKLLKTPHVFSQQLSSAKRSGTGECVIFHYGSLLESPELGRVFTRGLEP